MRGLHMWRHVAGGAGADGAELEVTSCSITIVPCAGCVG